jgi:hypothetical protein
VRLRRSTRAEAKAKAHELEENDHATAASAKPMGGGGGWGGNFHRHHFGVGFVGGGFDNGCFVTRPVRTPFGYRLRTINICGY